MPVTDVRVLTERVLMAWNHQDAEELLQHYTEDCVYLDPNTRGPLEGHAAFRRYLEKLFAQWQMTWTVVEHHPFAEARGGAFLWRAELAPAGADRATAKTVRGMDLVLLREDRIARNEVYFDRSSLFT